MSEDRICVGALAGSFGVHGEVRIKSFCAEPEDIGTYGPLWTEDGSRSFEIVLTRAIKTGFSAEITGVDTKEQADELRGIRLFADRDALPHLPDDEFYHADLIGLEVRDTGGAVLGTVSAVHNHGSSDLLEVMGPALKDPILLPFTQACIPTVDLATGRIIADPPEGILPE
ncbi:MAG: ribosome maturation factor RimM [Maritimibacter sp.]